MAEEPTIEDYLLRLQDENADVRRNAAWWLGRQRDITVVGPLIDAAQDEHPDVRLRVMESLGNFRDARVIAPLLAALAGDTSAEARAAAAQSLGRVGDASAVETLIAALDDAAPEVRTGAAQSLGQLADNRASEPLARALVADPDSDVRYFCAQSLANIGGPVTVDALLAVMPQAGDGPLLYILETLGQLFDQRAVEPLRPYAEHEDEGIRETARWALRNLGA